MESLCIVLLLLISTSYVLSQTVTLDQPGSTVVKPSGTLKLSCTVSASVTSQHWTWVRQKTGSGLEYMGYLHIDGRIFYAPSFQGRVTMTRETPDKLNLQMLSVTSADSAIYYCARYRTIIVGTDALDYWGKGTQVTVTSEDAKSPSVFPLKPCCGTQDSSISIGCLASGYLPQTLSIKWNAGVIQDGIKNFPPISNGDLYTSSSQLTISASDWKNKPYSCTVEHLNKTIEKQVLACAKESCPKVAIAPMPNVNKSINVNCIITGMKSREGLDVKWYRKDNKQEPQLISGSTLNWLDDNNVNSSLRSDVSEGDSIICSVRNKDCMKSVSTEITAFTGEPRKPSMYLFGPHAEELKEANDSYKTLICLIKGLFPKDIYIQWKEHGSPISEDKYKILNSEPLLYNGNLYIMVSMLTIPSENWTENHTYSCHSYHWSGTRSEYIVGK